MKKIIIALLILGTLCVNVFAQEYDIVEVGEEVDFNHSEVYLSAGLPSFAGLFSGIFVAVGQGLAQAVNENNTTESKKEAAFTLTGGYNYYFNEYVGLGAMITYEKFSALNLLTLQAKLTAQYGWEHFKIYHSLSGGILTAPGNASQVSPIFDVTYLGLKADFQNWSIFAEGSFPSTAIIKLGASYKF